MRLVLPLLASLALHSAPASAWDQSELADVRFSPDGRYFSFVEFVDSESGEHGFATMHVIDTESDLWAPGAPLRVEIKGEARNGERALRAIQDKGRALVARYGLVAARPPILPFRAVDRSNPFRHRQVAALPSLNGRLELRQRKAASAHSCNEDAPDSADFQLALTGRRQVKLADYVGRLPRSRGCAHAYDIAAAYLHEDGGRQVLAVLVGVFTPGWEGSDRNLIAVTKTLP